MPGEARSAISKAIGALEKRLGVRLFNRSTRRVTLTDQGHSYYNRAKPLIEGLDEVDSDLTSSTLNIAGQIRIAAVATFGRLHVLPLVPDHLAQHPGLQVDLILSDGMRNMADDRIDLAIRVGPVNEPDAIVRRVTGTPLVCVGSPDELRHLDVITVLDEFIGDVRDVSLIWPKRRYAPTRVRRVTDFFAAALLKRIEET